MPTPPNIWSKDGTHLYGVNGQPGYYSMAIGKPTDSPININGWVYTLQQNGDI